MARLLAWRPDDRPIRQQEWWGDLCRHLLHGSKDTSIEKHLEVVGKLRVAEPVRQAILATIALDWDTDQIQNAFSAFDEEDESFDEDDGPGDMLSHWREHIRLIMVPFLPPIALQKLAASPCWQVRYLVALHMGTAEDTRQRLSQDGNRYVRAVARAINVCRHLSSPEVGDSGEEGA
jgi:hypothetical protein